MSELSGKNLKNGVKVDFESVCRYFERIPESLIEEPEVCEWCEFFDNGFCFRENK